MKQISISEYGYIGCSGKNINNDFSNYTTLSIQEFEELYNYWLSNKETQKVFIFEDKNTLKAQNYVGVIQTKNLSVEILPKIYNGDEKETRNIFIEMLKVVYGLNELQFNKANLSTTKQNIFEIFISMFVKELDKLIHKGLKSDYILQQENQNFLKGKLKISQHLKRNYLHKERFFVEYDDYIQDRVENRLLKSTINFLLKKTKNSINKKNLRQQLFIFDNVRFSTNYERDISKINIYRAKHYKFPLELAKLFLKKFSFTSMSGDKNVFALLFPMEKLFENYLEVVLNNSKDELNIKNIKINGNRGDYFLSNKECQITNLQPDYLIESNDTRIIIADAKWKIKKENKCINLDRGDVFQMFAYLNFYENSNISYLLVPKVDDTKIQKYKYFNSNKKLKLIPLDLKKIIKNHKIKENIFK